MKQRYNNVQTFILDDSTIEETKKTIDLFAEQHQVTIVRREDKSGFKAGNLNTFLQKQKEAAYDFFVVLDSDEIIPQNFITDS